MLHTCHVTYKISFPNIYLPDTNISNMAVVTIPEVTTNRSLPPDILTDRPNTRSKVLLEKLTTNQLVRKFSAFYDTRGFITVFARAHYMSLP